MRLRLDFDFFYDVTDDTVYATDHTGKDDYGGHRSYLHSNLTTAAQEEALCTLSGIGKFRPERSGRGRGTLIEVRIMPAVHASGRHA